ECGFRYRFADGSWDQSCTPAPESLGSRCGSGLVCGKEGMCMDQHQASELARHEPSRKGITETLECRYNPERDNALELGARIWVFDGPANPLKEIGWLAHGDPFEVYGVN